MDANRMNRAVRVLTDSAYRARRRENIRLSQLPRYARTVTKLGDRRIEVVDASTFLHGVEEIFQKRIYEFRARSDTPVILDCGANIGLSVLFFKELYPTARIIAFEADPAIADVLRRNVDACEVHGVEVHNAGVWTAKGSLPFRREGAYSGRFASHSQDGDCIEVQTVRLRDYLATRIDMLKMDIEGAEYEVLMDCSELLGNVENLFFEYHSQESERQTLHELLQIVAGAGFRYHIQEAFTSSRPFVRRSSMMGMDLQLNIFCYRDGSPNQGGVAE